MVSRFNTLVWPVAIALSLGLSACAGTKSSSSSSSSDSSSEASAKTAPDEKTQKVDDARKSAEDAEAKAHQLREEKNRNQNKTSSN